MLLLVFKHLHRFPWTKPNWKQTANKQTNKQDTRIKFDVYTCDSSIYHKFRKNYIIFQFLSFFFDATIRLLDVPEIWG